MNDELTRLIESGPTADELARVRARVGAGFIRGAERIGGSSGKSGILARSAVFGGSPDAYKRYLDVLETATTNDLQQVGQQWLTDGVYTLTVEPMQGVAAASGENARGRLEGSPDALLCPATATGDIQP